MMGAFSIFGLLSLAAESFRVLIDRRSGGPPVALRFLNVQPASLPELMAVPKFLA
ncbi:hypothetical protein A8926_3835 [Saccharopolyspora spinosa]|uniref:Uncharacterized protein n=1 Tax=Saccharopolyspora spinosa TaxID=60894 RepID=A0A2N3XZE1_SACSN|nr:hypothetical protein A8926_3835 [Saccharopolyspora spinosa]